MSDKETIAVYDAKAAEYAELTKRPKPDRQLLEFVDALPSGGQVLDLGCGPGVAAGYLADQGWNALAWDPSTAMAALADAREGVTAEVKGFEDLKDLPSQSLVGVWANFSLLHAAHADLPGYIADIHRALQSGGVFHIALKTGTGMARDRIGRLYTYLEEDELLGLLTNAGLQTGKISKGRDKGLSGDIEDWVSVLSHA